MSGAPDRLDGNPARSRRDARADRPHAVLGRRACGGRMGRGAAARERRRRRARGRAVVGHVPADGDRRWACSGSPARRSSSAGDGAAARCSRSRCSRGSSTRRRTGRGSCAASCAGGATTVNLVGRVGESAGRATLVVLAHHDAPQTGALFDQTLQRRLHERAPERARALQDAAAAVVDRARGAARDDRRRAHGATPLRRRAASRSARSARQQSPTSGAARRSRARTTTSRASRRSSRWRELLREQPVPGLRVLLVSCGAEETLQDGIRAFVASHRDELDPARTAFVNLDTVGSPHLVMLEAEGPVWMESYAGPWLRDLVETHAERLGMPLLRGFRARASTDSVIPSRAGYRDRDARLGHRLDEPGQLPPAERRPGEPRLRERRRRDAARLQRRAGASGGAGRRPGGLTRRARGRGRRSR